MIIALLVLILLALLIGGDNLLALIMAAGVVAFYAGLVLGAGILLFAAFA